MDYDDWARALAKYWICISRDGEALLAIEPSILVDIAKEAGIDFDTKDDAVESFKKAVQNYQSLGRPWRLEVVTGEKAPRFLILIAIQILAAFQMDDLVGEYTSRAYYVQLGKLVGDRAMGANFAADFGPDHRALWQHLKEWLNKHNLTVRLPPDKKGTHDRNVGLPKSQALLRRADLAQLPVFFRKCGYRPGVDLSEERVRRDVQIRRSNAEYFPSNWARRVLEDEHLFPIAVRQILNELQTWDGEWELATPGNHIRESSGRNKCWFGISRKRSLLVAKVGRSIETSTFVSIENLKCLISGRKDENGHRLNLIDGLYFGRFDADDCMYQPVAGFEPGDRGLIAMDTRNPRSLNLLERLISCENTVTNTHYYVRESESQCDVTPLTGIPQECLFVTFDVSDPLPYQHGVDPVWHRFLKTPRPRLIPVGGLRFSRKNNWVQGAGPSIRIVGAVLPKSITIDDRAVKVDQRIVSHELLSEPGEHLVCATIDGVVCSPCRVLVSQPLEPTSVIESESRWRLASGQVPTWCRIEEGDNNLLGMHFLKGKREMPFDETISPAEERLAAIKALAIFPVASSGKSQNGSHHPLTKWLVESSGIERPIK